MGMLDSLLSGKYKKVGFFGLGKSNIAIMKMLPSETEIVLRSDREIDLPCGDVSITRFFTGGSALKGLDEDVLILSPSVRRDRPELIAASERGVILTSDAELFFENVAAPVFAVSGSDGKSTTATLVSLLLRQRFPSVCLCGNIGVPMVATLGESHDAFVCELSSFQLTYIEPTVTRAALTNITPNHLNWHKDYGEYRSVKMKLLNRAEATVLSADCEEGYRAAKAHPCFGITSTSRNYRSLKSEILAEIYYTVEDGCICKNGLPVFPKSVIKRREPHNIKNLLTALALTDGYVTAGYARAVAENFTGLPHRCETVLVKDGIEYVNSSIDTTPARTAQTIMSLDRPLTLLLGGRSKGVGFDPLIAPIKKYAVCVILFGECAEEIEATLSSYTNTIRFSHFSEAVDYALKSIKSGTLLLSPAATSYDEFSSFEERGDLFKKCVLSLKCK